MKKRNNDKHDKTLIIIFVGILYCSLLFIGINFVLYQMGYIGKITSDNWKTYEPKGTNGFINKFNNFIGSKEVAIENIVTNYFPLYNNILDAYSSMNYSLNDLFYDDIIPIKINGDGELIKYNKEKEYYYLIQPYSKEELDNRMKKQVDFFNSLDADVYIYNITSYQLSKFYDKNNYIEVFKSKLNNNIKFDYLKVNSEDDYLKYYYKTDHHLQAFGSLNVYYDVVNLLDVNPVNNIVISKIDNKKIYGSYAKTASSDLIYDNLSYLKANLNYDVNIDDKLFKTYEIPDNKKYKYYDYYVYFFNGQYDEVIYDYHDENKENLLILSDSFAWPIDDLIAASFNKTYVVNLRYGKYKGQNFDLTSYIKDNNISKVLFMYGEQSIIFDGNNYDFVGRVK